MGTMGTALAVLGVLSMWRSMRCGGRSGGSRTRVARLSQVTSRSLLTSSSMATVLGDGFASEYDAAQLPDFDLLT